MLKSNKKEKTLTLGILGGGQLAKMLAIEAYRLGLNIAIIENSAGSPAGDMTKLDFSKGWNNKEELNKFIETSDIATLENEFINPDILEYISKKIPVFPSAETMRLVQDKFVQKTVFQQNEIQLPDFLSINNISDMLQFGEKYSYPFLIKTRTLGYDGYGNYTVNSPEECEIAYNKFNSVTTKKKLMAESFVNFKAELAVMVARNKTGQIAVYPCVETVQKNHICHKVIAPARISPKLSNRAKNIAISCVESINGIGVFGIEMFLTKNNEILVNEIAPRPHNSGHYTIEACVTSQYENAIRAVLNLPLGSTEMLAPAACMINLLGEKNGIGIPENISEVLTDGKTHLHLYNKKESRMGRKMGHLTTLGNSTEDAISAAEKAYNNFVW